jgi:hypothetical protein
MIKFPAIALFCIVLLSGQTLHAHQQRVHQYIVKEAYELLLQERGNVPVPRMNDHIGGLGVSYYGARAWEIPFITTGAWREDEEDVIFGYRLSNLLNNYSLVSISHFWDADQGDLNRNLFRVNPAPFIVFDIGPYENAYDKLLRYANGGWILWFPDSILVRRVSNNHVLLLASIAVPPPAPTGIPMAYSSLTAFFQSNIINLRGDVTGAYVVFDLNEQRVIQGEAFDVLLDQQATDRIVWEVLGRMCHLIGDMSVPAHSRRDEHGLNPDSYENWAGTEGGPYLTWTHSTVGHSINPYNADNDPLHYLMYTMQQQSNHFGSNGPYEGNGNNMIGGQPRPEEIAFLTSVNLPGLGEPTGNGPWTEINLRNILDKTLPYSIRAVAGLLYWFARETRLIVTGVGEATQALPDWPTLQQNYPNPFNASTKIGFEFGDVGFVSLKVFDVLGREVATLVNEEKQPGTYAVHFDASGLASGVYFCRLSVGGRAGRFVETKKLTVLR